MPLPLKTFLDILLLRRGPEDLPASTSALWTTLVAFLALNIALHAAFRVNDENWIVQIFVSVGLSLAWFRILLALFRKPERYVQTMMAVLGVGLVLAPVIVPIAGLAEPPPGTPPDTPPEQLTNVWMFLLLPVGLYIVFVTARILKAAIEQPMFLCVLLVFLQAFVEFTLLLALFGVPDAAATGAGAGAGPAPGS